MLQACYSQCEPDLNGEAFDCYVDCQVEDNKRPNKNGIVVTGKSSKRARVVHAQQHTWLSRLFPKKRQLQISGPVRESGAGANWQYDPFVSKPLVDPNSNNKIVHTSKNPSMWQRTMKFFTGSPKKQGGRRRKKRSRRR